MKIGDNVIYTLEDMEYLGTIVSKSKITGHYFVSVVALGRVIESDGTDLQKI